MKRTILVAVLSLCLAATASAQCEFLEILPESMPTFTLNEPANIQLEVIGGDGPYHFEIVEGTLPAGLHLTPSGRVVGRPTTATFDTTVFITVTDSQGCHTTRAYAIYVGDI
ncbi:MAG TPA: putative Ig domain-containing protein [Thermoanaerobaculia bacterium]